MQDLNITLVQTSLEWEDKASNLSNLGKIIDEIKGNSHLIILPEMFNTGFSMHPEKLAENMYGETLDWMMEKSKLINAVICGSLIIHENEKYFNRLVWMRPDGSFETYDKRHLFRMANEQEKFSQGNKKLIVELLGWKIRPLICYDLRFPVWSKNNFQNNEHDYDFLIYIANWPYVRSYHWKTLLAARAIENQVFVAGVNRVGLDGNQMDHSGDSALIDPLGNYVVSTKPFMETVISTTLKAEILTNAREKFQVGMDWDNFEIF